MSKKLLLLIVSAMVITFAAQTGFGSQRAASESLLPENSDLFFRIAPLQNLYNHLAIKPKTILGQPTEDLDSIIEVFGFNPFDINALKQHGLDTTGEIGVAVSGFYINADTDEEPSLSFHIIFPAENTGKLHALITRILRQTDETLQLQQQGKKTMFVEPEGLLKGYIEEQPNNITLNFSYNLKPKALIPSIKPSSLQASKPYQYIISQLNPQKHDNLLFINVKQLLSDNMGAFKQMLSENGNYSSLEYIEDFVTVGACFDLGASDFRLKTAANIVPGSNMSKVFPSKPHHDRATLLKIPEKPVLLISLALQMPDYYQYLISSFSDEKLENFKSLLEFTNTEYGIDLEKDLIGNLAGGINIGIFDGRTITMSSFNALISLTLKNGAAMKQTLEKFIAKLPADQRQQISTVSISDIETYIINIAGMSQLFIGIHENRLLLSFDRSFYEKALAKDTKSGFIGKLSDQTLVKTLNSSNDIILINVDELLFAVNNFAPLLNLQSEEDGSPSPMDTISKALSNISYILNTGRMNNNTIVGELVIKTGFNKPFVTGVADIIEQLKALQ